MPGQTHRRSRSQRLVAALLLATLLTPLAAGAAEAPELRSLDGPSLRWNELDEGDWIVVVWAGWSPRCRDIVTRVNRIEERWGKRARVVTINFQEEASAARQFLRGQELRAPVYLDLDAGFSKRQSISHLPGLLVKRGGETTFVGQLPRDAESVIERALTPPAGS